MKKPAIIALTAVVTFVLTSMMWGLGIFIVWSHFSASAPFVVTVESPETVQVGEEFRMIVEARNASEEKTKLGSIDLYNSLGDGFEVVRVSPSPDRVQKVFDFTTYYIERQLLPNETAKVTFTMRAKTAGTWTGQIDCCTPSENYASATASVRVESDGPVAEQSE